MIHLAAAKGVPSWWGGESNERVGRRIIGGLWGYVKDNLP